MRKQESSEHISLERVVKHSADENGFTLQRLDNILSHPRWQRPASRRVWREPFAHVALNRAVALAETFQ